MLTVTRTLDELIDDTLQEVARYDERGYQVVLDATGLTTTTATTCSLVDASSVNVSDVLEFGSELMLVTAKSADATPVLTVSRGYDGSTAAIQAASTVGLANPQFPRSRVAKVIQTAITRLQAARIFPVTNTVFNRTTDLQYIEMPSDCRQVLRVGYMDLDTGRFDEVDGWRFFDNLPTSVVTSGKIVRLPRIISNDDDLSVTYQGAMRWSSYPADPEGDDTITLPEGAEDLPSMYASARLVSRRELTRLDLTRSEEWNKSQAIVNGITQGAIRQMWQEFYKALDEAKSLNVLPIPRPFVPKRRFL